MPEGTQRFGELLVELGLVTNRQVTEALSVQSLTGQRVGESLISLGYLTRSQMQRAMATAISRGAVVDLDRPPLGEIMIGLGVLTEAALNKVLETQRNDGRRLGELLIESKVCTHSQVYEALGLQQRMSSSNEKRTRTITGEIPIVGRRRVVVIDDSELACTLVSEGLKGEGYDVAAFVDPFLALEQIEVLKPDMVLTDLDMPGIGGAELCRRLKTLGRQSMPVIVLTASEDESARVALLRAGADDFVNKGASMDEIAARIETILRRTNETRHMKKLFARYTSDEVVDEVLRSGDLVLTGEKREVTVVFADIRNFTSLAETLPPEQVMGLLNEILGGLADAVLEYQGTLDKFLGDGLMAVWGAPVRREDDALAAVRSCVAMLNSVAARNLTVPGMQRIDIGLGINTGIAIVGSVGNARRTEYTCIGDTVNIASRLCSQAAPGEILLGENTAHQLGNRSFCESLPPVKLKGKSNPVPLFRLTDEAMKAFSID